MMDASSLPRVHRREGEPILKPQRNSTQTLQSSHNTRSLIPRTKSDPLSMHSHITPSLVTQHRTKPVTTQLLPQKLPPPLQVHPLPNPNPQNLSPVTPAHSPQRASDRVRREDRLVHAPPTTLSDRLTRRDHRPRQPRCLRAASRIHSESTGSLLDLPTPTTDNDPTHTMFRTHRRRASESSNFYVPSQRRNLSVRNIQLPSDQTAPRKRSRLLAYSDFTLDKTLGSGGTAVVVRAQPKPGSCAAAMIPAPEVALKVVGWKGMNRRARHYLEREIFIHNNVQRHPHIVSLYEVFRDSSSVYLVMEFLRGSDLYSALKRERRGLSEKVALTVMAQILDALQYMHSLGYAHRDIKPENIMFVEKPALSDGRIPSVKLVDFGLACARDPSAPEKERHSSEKCGTLRYAAPEIVTEPSYIPELCDIWSVGIVLYSIIAHRNPYTGKTEKEVLHHIQNTPLSFEDPEWKRVSEDTKNLIRSCLSRKPSDRPNAAKALEETHRILDVLSRSPRSPSRGTSSSDREGDFSGFSSHVTPERASSNRRRDTGGNGDEGSTPRRDCSDDGQGQPANFFDGLIKAFFSGGSSPDRSGSDDNTN